MNYRFLKVLLSALLATHISLIAFNNISDYNSNFRFVNAIMSMEDVFSDHNRWRSVESPILQHLAYLAVIVIEVLVAVLMWIGTFRQLYHLSGSSDDFSRSSQMSVYGLMLGLVLWLGIFLSISGEWFLMWQSAKWNAQPSAFFLTIVYLLVLHLQLRREIQRIRQKSTD